MYKYILAGLLAGTIVTPAFAQDASPFSGIRVEGIAGYDSIPANDTENDDASIKGLLYGVGAGFDFDLGNVVIGIEGEYSHSTGKTTFTEDGDTASAKVGRDLYVGGRLGFRVGQSTLAYAKAGYSNLALEGFFSDGGAARINFDGETDGLRLGAGVEQLFGPNAYGKLEYRYSNYGDMNFNATVGGVNLDDLESDFDSDRHQVVVGFGFRF
jgi:outer membrane immunogenic protein